MGGRDKPEDLNDPRRGPSGKNFHGVIFDSSPSAKGACALNGPASPACKWRECEDVGCYAYPKSTGPYTTWYGASSSLKVVVGGTGGLSEPCETSRVYAMHVFAYCR